MYDLIVIGGGPAGTSVAILAARSGASVLLLERGRFPRHKVCGEFVSAESLELLSSLLDLQHATLLGDAVRIPQARLFLDGTILCTPVSPPAASITRLDFDAALWDSAANVGVEARQQTTVQSIVGAGPFRISTPAGDFDARAVVNASGRWSNLTSEAAFNGKLTEKRLGLKAYFSEPSPHLSADLYFFDGGYCGVQPVSLNGNSRVNACAMVRADRASTLAEVFALHPILLERSRQWRPLSDSVNTSPLLFRDPQPEHNGVLMVGDAAGFVDPFVGDGISLALLSGSLAARFLTPFFRKEVSLQDAVQSYSRTYQERLAPVFRASSGIRRLLGLPRSVRKPLLFVFAKTPALTRYLARKTRGIAETETADANS